MIVDRTKKHRFTPRGTPWPSRTGSTERARWDPRPPRSTGSAPDRYVSLVRRAFRPLRPMRRMTIPDGIPERAVERPRLRPDVSCGRAFLSISYGRDGAGSGNRTRIFSLEGCCSTIELYPRVEAPGAAWWRGLDSNQRRLSQRIYSPSPLTTRTPLRIRLPEPCDEAGFHDLNRKSAKRLMATGPCPVNRAARRNFVPLDGDRQYGPRPL